MKTKNAVRLVKDRKNDQSGFSLIESAIVLAVMGLVIGGIWVAAAAVQSNWREQSAQTQLLQIVANVRELYQSQRTMGSTVDMKSLITASVFPAEMVASDNTAQNPWNGDVAIAQANSGKEFTVTSQNVPDQACINLITRNIETAADYGLTALTAGSTKWDTPAKLQAVDPATAAGACSNQTSNTLVWQYNLRG